MNCLWKNEKAADIFFRLSDQSLTPPLRVSKPRRINAYLANSQEKHNSFQNVRSHQPASTRYHVARIVSCQTKLSNLPYTSRTSLHLWTSKYKINKAEDRQEIWFLNTRQSVNGCADDIETCALWRQDSHNQCVMTTSRACLWNKNAYRIFSHSPFMVRSEFALDLNSIFRMRNILQFQTLFEWFTARMFQNQN